MESLRIALTNNPLTWVHDFVNEGLKQVLSILNECYRRYVRIIGDRNVEPDYYTFHLACAETGGGIECNTNASAA